MTKKKGTLQYDRESGRFDIHFDDGKCYGGLHCGECLDVRLNEVWVPTRIEMSEDWYLVGEVWVPTRIEMSEDWYLVGLPELRLEGLTVQIGGYS